MVNLTTEEAIAELSRYANQEFYTPQNREAHRMAIEALERSQWIPVEKRLPEQYMIVGYDGEFEPMEFNVMIKGAELPATLCFNGKNFHNWDGQIYDVTHWLPMPEPPRKDGAV